VPPQCCDAAAMTDLGNASELEAELIKRNREIAKVRDEVLKVERRLEDAQMRNDDLLEKVSELDSEVTTKSKHIVELEEKAHELEEEVKTLQEEHKQHVETLRVEFEASLAQAENGSREAASHVLEHKQKLKEMEEALKAKEEGISAAQAKQLEEERAKMDIEVQRAMATVEEHKALREDVEGQAKEREQELIAVRGELEDLRREAGDHAGTVADLEASRDEIRRKYEDLLASQDETLKAERKRNEEHLERAMQQAAALDGRLSGQRLLLQETSQALERSEEAEATLAAELAEKARELSLEYEAARTTLQQRAEQASKDLSSRHSWYQSELQSEEVCLRRHANSEVDAANRISMEVEEREKRLEARVQALLADHEEAKSHHGRSQEMLRNQTTDLRQRLTEAEEQALHYQQEAEKLRKDVEEGKLEAERLLMAHKQEVERYQQTLEAENQMRSSAERISQSQLEEKDTLLEHRIAAIERLEHELGESRRRGEELEAAVAKAREDVEAKVHAMGVRNAQLEGELRSRQERLTEVEGRLEAQRQYLEQVNATLNQAQTDRDTLLHTKGSLEAQLKQELSHKDAVMESLQQAQDESTRRCKELEERILRDRDTHRDAMDEVKRSVADDFKQGSERLQAVEAELLTARQRCELLMRNKADLQREVEEHREKHSGLEASSREHRAEQERLTLELDQQRSARFALEEEVTHLKKDRLDCEAKIKELAAQVSAIEEQRSALRDDFGLKVQRLDELLNREREEREAAERSLAALRRESQDELQRCDQERRQGHQELQQQVDSWREKVTELEHHVAHSREQAEAHRSRIMELDGEKREAEASLRSELAVAKTRIQHLEAEVQRKEAALEDFKASSTQQQASASGRIAGLERQLEREASHVKSLQAAKEAAEKNASSSSQGNAQMMERLSMAAEELVTRQIEFALDKQRLSGALEESRRTLRNSLGVPNPVAAVDSVRISGLEQQLSEERRKSIEQMVALQRAERKVRQLEDTHRRSEEHRGDAVQSAREAERRCVTLTEDLRKAHLRQSTLEVRCEETRERAAMGAAEIGTVRYESKYEAAKLRGALDELRYMLKMQDSPNATSRGYPLRRPG